MPSEIVMPRSGCSTSSVSSTHRDRDDRGAARTSSGACTARRATSTCAPHSVSATFTASDGCTENDPNANQARDPLRIVADGISTATSDSTPTTQRDRGERAQPRAAGSAARARTAAGPGTQNISCRVNTEYDEPSGGERLHRRRREHHDQPEQREQPEHAEHQVQRGERAAQPLAERGCRAADREAQPVRRDRPPRRAHRPASGSGRRRPRHGHGAVSVPAAPSAVRPAAASANARPRSA